MVNDLRYAIRTLSRNPLFAAMALLSLALGIGANTAIYSFMDAILVRSLPVQNPESLVVMQWHSKTRGPIVRSINGTIWNDPELGRVSPNLPWPAFEVLRENNSVLSQAAAFRSMYRITAVVHGQGALIEGLYCTGSFFGLLGTPPAAGRLLGPEDDQEGISPVAVVSYGFAQRRFGGAEQALGRTIVINDTPFSIVGVTHPGFPGISPGQRHDVYAPMQSSLQVERINGGNARERFYDPRRYWVEILGRLKPGVTTGQAQAALGPAFQRFLSSVATSDAERKDLPILAVQDASRGLEGLRRQYSKPLFFLMTLVGLILTIACANLANLLLARAAGRRREIAVRLSVGAGRMRIIRQLLTESVLLAVMGSLLGLAFAQWGVRGLTLLMANGRESFQLAVDLNWRVLAVTVGLALVTGVLFGLAPALQSSTVDLSAALKQTRAGESRKRIVAWVRVSLSQVLVVNQIAVSLLLLVAAGLFARTLGKLNSVELGFNREHLLLFGVNARQAGYRDQAIAQFLGNLHQRLGAIPGVRSATASDMAMVANSVNSGGVTILDANRRDGNASFLSIAPDFFRTMEIPILLGRPIDGRDVSAGAKVAVVNELFVKNHFDGQNPLGRRFTTERGGEGVEIEIVGVAANARYSTLKGGLPAVVYLPYTYEPRQVGGLTFELRATGDPRALAGAVREIVRQADPRIPVTDVRTQDAAIDQTIGQERTFAILCTAFALLAVAIAGVGLYGTMAYSVARRTNEIGLRMALGAERAKLIWMVLREVFLMAAGGLAIGLPVVFATNKFVQSFLFEITPNDPWAITGATFVLVLVAVMAGYGPALRASKIDPWNALRHE